MGTFDVTHGHAAAAGRQLLEALFPGRCLLCGRWLSRGDDLCAALCAPCRGTLAPIGAGRCAKCGTGLVSEIGICTRCREAGFIFESNIAIFPYLREAKELIRKYKFGGRIRLAGFFADRAAEALPAEWETYPIVPVPPRPGRRIPDPVGRIAACLEKQRGKTVRRLLVRTG